MKMYGWLTLMTLIYLPVEGADFSWTLSTPMPETRSDYASGLIGNKLIVAGGTFWTGSKDHWIQKQFSQSTHSFDTRTHTWEKLPDLPIPLATAGSAVIDGRLFVVGGYTGTEANRKVFVLEQHQGKYTWKDFAAFPFDRVYPRAVSVGNLLYVLGGTKEFERRDPSGTCCSSKTATRTLLVLDVTKPNASWQQLAEFPGDLCFYFGLETDGTALWMFGGIYQGAAKDPVIALSQVYRYDIGNRKWAKAQPLPEVSMEGNSPSPVFAGNGIVLVNESQKVWKLDLKSQEYREMPPLPKAAAVDRFVYIDGQIIGASGENFEQGPRRRSEWVFIGKYGAH